MRFDRFTFLLDYVNNEGYPDRLTPVARLARRGEVAQHDVHVERVLDGQGAPELARRRGLPGALQHEFGSPRGRRAVTGSPPAGDARRLR